MQELTEKLKQQMIEVLKLEEVKPEDFKTAANKFIDMNRYVKVVLMPEK